MPAYRSDAEGEVREAVVARLRQIRPDARIMHEVNASSFGNRIDVLAVSRAEIIAVEIKSAKDKLDRLNDQMKAMRKCAHHAIPALHERLAVSWRANPETPFWQRSTLWVYPETSRWREPRLAIAVPLPSGALDMLWRDELLEMCGRYSVCVGKRPTMGQMLPALRWQLSGRDLTLGICAVLRARKCIEADPEIEWRCAA